MDFRSGVARLDALLHGGCPAGLCLITGEPASGKTTLAGSFIREAVISGKLAAYITLEGLPEKSWLMKCGSPINCLVAEAKGTAGMMHAASKFILNGVSLVVLDTISMLATSTELSGEDTPTAMRARLLYQSLYWLNRRAKERGALVVATTQVRSNMRGGLRVPYMGPRTEVLAHTHLWCSRVKSRTSYGEFAYLQTEIHVRSCKYAPPGGKVHAFVWPDLGIDRNFERLMYLEQSGTLVRTGAWWTSSSGEKFGPGFKEASRQLADKPELS